MSDSSPLAHIVYFTLRERSDSAIDALVAACRRYLSDHPGVLYFGVGKLAGEFTREVNVRDFDVALHVVFENKAAHDRYQADERHLAFIAENKPNWASVRVFDSYLQ
jgi:hypothetical protein